MNKLSVIMQQNKLGMKSKLLNFGLLLCLLSFALIQIGTSQCTGDSWDFDEDDFMPGSVMATETMNSGPVTTNQIDLNGDGTMDIELTYEARVITPNVNGTCDDGDFMIGAGFGGTGALTTSSDFAGTTSDDCPCTNGIIIMTVDMINGFNSDVANFEFNATSQNGSSEAYEYGFGFVTGATNAGGAPIAGLNSAAAASGALASFCNAQYAAGTTASQHALTSTTGVFTTQADDLNATMNDCATSGQNGEDTDSGTGPNSSLSTGVSGLAPTDLITQVTYIYGLSNSPGTDCDGDGDTGVGSNPSGSFSGIDGCFTPPVEPCGFTFDVVTNESCGEFTIDITNVMLLGPATAPGTFEVSTDGGLTFSSFMPGVTVFPADGTTMFIVRLIDSVDATCISDPQTTTAPAGTSPNVPVFVPNNPTTGN